MAAHPSERKVDRTPLTGRLTIQPPTHVVKERSVLHLPYRELPDRDAGTPDTRSPLRYLLWIARQQRWLLTLNALFGIGWMVSQALLWAAVGAAIDHGIARHNDGALFRWVGVVIGLGLFQAVCGSCVISSR